MQYFKPHIFLTAANSKLDLPNLANEFEGINKSLGQARAKNLCEIEERSNLKPNDLIDMFNDFEHEMSIFHYAGHATNERIDGLYIEGMAKLLSTQKNLVLVFLNACSTESHLAHFLDTKPKIPCLILTDKAIGDKMASEFATYFYKCLGNGNDIDTAFMKAKALVTATYSEKIYKIGLQRRSDRQRKQHIPWQIHYNNESFKTWTLPKAADKPLSLLPDLQFEKKDLPNLPFIGLKPYTKKYAPIFFGRDAEISDLYFKTIDETDHNIILLNGQSGAGKSSLLTAGLLPRLQTHFFCDEEYYFRRSQEKGLSYILRYFLETDHIHEFQDKWLALEQKHQKPVLLVIDQVEEIFTSQAKTDEKNIFFEQIKAIFGEASEKTAIRGKLIISFRKEYLAEMTKIFLEKNIKHQTPYFVETLNRKNIIQAIKGITAPPYSDQKNVLIQGKYQLKIEKGLAESMSHELLRDDKSAIAPSLQILLYELWQNVQEQGNEKEFTLNLYHALRAKTLEQYLDKQLTDLENDIQYQKYVQSGLVLSLLKKYTTPEITANEYNALHHAEADFDEQEGITMLIKKLKDSYLLTDTQTTRLAHDTLAKYVHKKYNDRLYPAQKAESILVSHLQTKDTILSKEELAIVKAGRTGMYKLSDEKKEIILASEIYHKQRKRTKNLKRFGGIAILILVLLFSGQFITVSVIWVLLLVILMYYI